MAEDKKNKLMDFIRGRKIAYASVFAKDRQDVSKVLADLAKFCRANETTFHSDPRAHAAMEGRREVWLRITRHLNLTTEELFNITTKGTIE